MLQTIHQYKRTFIGSIGLALVTIMMAGFGLEYFNHAPKVSAIKVNDTEISPQDFYEQKRRVEDSYRSIFGPAYEKFFQSMNLNQKVIDQMIAQVLINNFADSLGMTASPRDVGSVISKMPIFTKGFNSEVYKTFLKQVGMSMNEFEGKLSDEVLSRQFSDLLNDIAYVSKREVQANLLDSETKYDIVYLEFDPKVFISKLKTPSDAELESFFSENATKYELPKRVKYDYVALDVKDFSDGLTVSPEDIEIYYTDHENKFKEPEQVKVRQIQISFPKDKSGAIDQKKKDEMRALAETLIGRITGGEDFEQLVRQYSDDFASKQNGGDLGWVTKGKLSKDLEDAVFKIKNGGVSELVVSNYAFYILKAESYKPASTKPLEVVSDQIRKILLAEQAPSYVSDRAHQLFEQWKKSQLPLAEYAVQNNLVAASSSKLLDPTQDITPNLSGLTKKIIEFSDLKQQIVDLSDKTVLVELKELRESEIPGFNEVKDKLIADFKIEQSKVQAQKTAQESLAGFAKGVYSDLGALAKTLGLETKEILDNSKTGMRKEILADSKLSKDIFSSHTAMQKPTSVYNINGKDYLVQVKAIKQPKAEEIQTKLKDSGSQLSKELGFELYSAVINRLKARATIDVNANVLAN